MGDFKFCKDCKHSRPDNMWWLVFIPVFGWVSLIMREISGSRWRYALCSKGPKGGGFYTNGRTDDLYFCSVMREYECGANANFFETRK